MKILLLGANGRLGQKIAQKFSEKKVDFVAVGREHTESFESFRNFLVEQEMPVLILDVSLPQVTHQIVGYLHEMLKQNLLSDFGCQMSDDRNRNQLTDNRHQPTDNRNQTSDNRQQTSDLRLIIGTTGHTPECLSTLKQLSNYFPICLTPNFSKGIFLFSKILQTAFANGETLPAFAQKLGFKITLTDAHHKHKKDAPSGTALYLNQWLNLNPNEIVSIREGETIGEHLLTIEGENETIELAHKVTSRDVFAEGAYDLTMNFIAKHLKPGLYSVSDIWS